MPTYEFRCPAGHEFEQFHRKISAAPYVLVCPTCGQEARRKVSGGAGLHFKGSGFYITDYGKDGKKDLKSPPSKSTSSSSSESSSASKTESGSSESGSKSSESSRSESTKAGDSSSGSDKGSKSE